MEQAMAYNVPAGCNINCFYRCRARQRILLVDDLAGGGGLE